MLYIENLARLYLRAHTYQDSSAVADVAHANNLGERPRAIRSIPQMRTGNSSFSLRSFRRSIQS
jgi:hypothetical protein